MDFFTQFFSYFKKEDLAELESFESYFHFEKFDHEDALNLGLRIVELAKEMGDIAVMIVREGDELAMFQYVFPNKRQKNINYCIVKRNAVLKTGHMSCWSLVKQAVDGGLDDMFTPDSTCNSSAGAYPVYVKGEHAYTICVSGLHEGKDLTIMLKALSGYLGIDDLEYHGFML